MIRLAATLALLPALALGQVVGSSSSNTPGVFAVCGRLTLTTAVPVTVSDVNVAGTVYFTPHRCNFVTLYNGTRWVTYTFSELSQATTDATKSPAAVANNTNYDVFVWNDAGTLRATRGPAWTSATARGSGAGTTQISLQNGRYVNTVAITNGPGALLGLYVGTVRSDGSAGMNDSMAKRHVWNQYNRVARAMRVLDTTNSWTYSTASWQQANNSATNQLDVVRGLDEEVVSVQAFNLRVSSSTSTLRFPAMGIGLDGISGPVSGSLATKAAVSNGVQHALHASYTGFPGLGRHYFTWIEKGDGTDTQTWRGDDNTTDAQSGITGVVFQ